MAGARAALSLSLLLLACSGGDGEEAAALMAHALATTRASLAAAGAPAPSPVPPAAAAPAASRIASLPPAVPRQRGSGGPQAAATLVGTRAEEMRRLLGEPALRRPEGEAEVWLYEAADCRLDVVLYRENGTLVVAHAAARSVGAASVTEAACLAAIAAAPGTTRGA